MGRKKSLLVLFSPLSSLLRLVRLAEVRVKECSAGIENDPYMV